MAKKAQKKTNKRAPAKPSEPRVKDFLDLSLIHILQKAPDSIKMPQTWYVNRQIAAD